MGSIRKSPPVNSKKALRWTRRTETLVHSAGGSLLDGFYQLLETGEHSRPIFTDLDSIVSECITALVADY